VPSDFIREIIDEDNRTGKHGGRVLTRFPPEPNGYLHIGHAKSICLNFGIARDYTSRCNLRFDDTNPVKEDVEYVESIMRDVQWLGFSFGELALYASDYFEEMYQLAEDLVRDGKAYVDHLTDEEIKDYRGSLSEAGRPSPHRDRSVDENLTLLRQMRGGSLPDGTCVLRAKIDLAASNMKMRDPLLYRIRHAHHHRTGDAWCIYPMYDYAHPISDAIEGITHSICTLEFENNRELYDWVVRETRVSERHGFKPPQQIEFARLALDYTVMSKRKLLTLVKDKHVDGWDDPRMPTLAGMRRRGYSAEAIRAFCELIGVAKTNSMVDIGKLEYCVRDDLNRNATRALGVLRPLEVVVTSDDSRKLYIDRDDFRTDPPDDYLRLAPGRTVRLRNSYCIACDEVIEKDGEVVALRVHHLPDTIGTNPDGVKVWGVLHWVDAKTAVPAEVRLYDRLFKTPRPEDAEGDFIGNLNPRSLEIVTGALLQASFAQAEVGSRWQLERVGYFIVDSIAPLVLNRIITLRDEAVREERRSTEPREKSAKAKTRPPKKSGAEFRTEARARDAALALGFEDVQKLGLDEKAADIVAGDHETLALFRGAVAGGGPAIEVANWIVNVLDDSQIEGLVTRAARFGEIVAQVVAGAVARVAAKDAIAKLAAGEEVSLDTAAVDLDALIEQVMSANADKVAQYRAGKTALLGFFVGQVVKASKGSAQPQEVQRLLSSRLA
jgi:glutaminyl-tRNA synthetase